MRTFWQTVLLCVIASCSGEDDPLRGAPELGTGDSSPSSVAFTVIASAADGLAQPRDLAFNPLRPDELWIINHDDDSMVIVFGTPGDGRTSEKRVDGYALHFMEQVTAIAFGQDQTTFGLPGTFGTCGESRNTYNGQAPPNDFTGPTLWSSDLSIFAKMNPNGLGSHLDMLHNTPLCMGIAHEADNRYWTFNGLAGSIDRYDFADDDGIGNDNHSDGLTWRFAEGQLGYVAGVPSHLVWDGRTSILYIADPGNQRVARLDGLSGTEGQLRNGFETPIRDMQGAVLEDVVPPGTLGRPSGLELKDDVLFVADNDTSRITAYDLDGQELNHLDTGLPPGSLGGLTFGSDEKLYFTDLVGHSVLRIDP